MYAHGCLQTEILNNLLITIADFVILAALGFSVNGSVNTFRIPFYGSLVWICLKCDKLRPFTTNFRSIKADKTLHLNKGSKDSLHV